MKTAKYVFAIQTFFHKCLRIFVAWLLRELHGKNLTVFPVSEYQFFINVENLKKNNVFCETVSRVHLHDTLEYVLLIWSTSMKLKVAVVQTGMEWPKFDPNFLWIQSIQPSFAKIEPRFGFYIISPWTKVKSFLTILNTSVDKAQCAKLETITMYLVPKEKLYYDN